MSSRKRREISKFSFQLLPLIFTDLLAHLDAEKQQRSGGREGIKVQKKKTPDKTPKDYKPRQVLVLQIEKQHKETTLYSHGLWKQSHMVWNLLKVQLNVLWTVLLGFIYTFAH